MDIDRDGLQRADARYRIGQPFEATLDRPHRCVFSVSCGGDYGAS